MQIYLDLLPQERKNKIKKEIAFKKVIFQEIRLLMPILFFLTILFSLKISLDIQLESLEKVFALENSQKEYQELKNYESKFMEINAKVDKASLFQSKHIFWSNIFMELSSIIPEKIQITSIASADYSIALSGKAKTREDLLALQDKIRSSHCFASIDIPLSNLVSRDDVVFQASLEINPDCLNQKE